MSKNKTVRVYDYVNHPYRAVQKKLTADALDVFHNATRVAALRAGAVATELHVYFAGIEIGTDISISIKSIEERADEESSQPQTRILLEWKSANLPHLFPLMKAELTVFPLTAAETQLDLAGSYEAPFGFLGSVFDTAIGHRIAEAAVHQFIHDIAVYLRAELSK